MHKLIAVATVALVGLGVVVVAGSPAGAQSQEEFCAMFDAEGQSPFCEPSGGGGGDDDDDGSGGGTGTPADQAICSAEALDFSSNIPGLGEEHAGFCASGDDDDDDDDGGGGTTNTTSPDVSAAPGGDAGRPLPVTGGGLLAVGSAGVGILALAGAARRLLGGSGPST